nr:lysylphosphatidylglycerol synthase domain-containing protein [Prochlorococcus sp. MIT 1341]
MLKRYLFSLLNFLKSRLQQATLFVDIRIIITFTCIGFVLYSLIDNASQLSQINLEGKTFILLSFGAIFSWISLIINAIAWKILINWQGYKVQNISLVSLFLRSNILKYLPGGVWHFIERIRVLRMNLGGSSAISAVLFEPILMVVAALLWVPFGGWQAGLAVCCCLPPVVLLPRCRKPVLKLFRKLKLKQMEKIEKEFIESTNFSKVVDEGTKYPFAPLGWEMLFIFFRFVGFWFCLKAFSITTQIAFGQWLAAFVIAWTGGLVVPAAPGGVGVFEAIIFLRLGALVPEAPFLAALIAYRVVSTLADVLAAFMNPSDSFYVKAFKEKLPLGRSLNH